MRTLSRQDARLTLQFLPLVASVRWRLWRTPFARLQSQWRDLVQSELDRAIQGANGAVSSPSLDEAALKEEVWREAHAVKRAARFVPRGSCLTQAMALQLVLARRGQPCAVRIGVNRRVASNNPSTAQTSKEAVTPATDSSRFEAHAWVEWRERVILGGDISRWKPLTIFAPATASASPHVAERLPIVEIGSEGI